MSQPIREGQILTGPLFNEPMRIETVASNGSESGQDGADLVAERLEREPASTLFN